MRIDERIENYLSEAVVDPKITKVAKDEKGPVKGSVQTLLLLLSDIYDLPETQVATQFKKYYPDVETTDVVMFIKKIKKAATDLGI